MEQCGEPVSTLCKRIADPKARDVRLFLSVVRHDHVNMKMENSHGSC